uniref:Uncharacterized protein n=1 Tax=Rhizophora mucronata TaxID=61149 RepID=A0A2P2IHM8_RHIMU
MFLTVHTPNVEPWYTQPKYRTSKCRKRQ